MKAQDPKVYLEIKRGEGILRRRNIENWQKIKNDSLGQLILSVLLQRPGTARSNKKKIFSDRGTYNSIFKRTHDKETIVDLLQLANYYDDFVKLSNLSEKPSNIANNGRLCVLAIIGFISSGIFIEIRNNDFHLDTLITSFLRALFGYYIFVYVDFLSRQSTRFIAISIIIILIFVFSAAYWRTIY